MIAASNAGAGDLRSATDLGVQAFLDYPIAHHAWVERLLSEEARLQPRLADTFSLSDLPQRTDAAWRMKSSRRIAFFS